MKSKSETTFLAKLMVRVVGFVGSWLSILLHTLFFASWFYFKFPLEFLLVIVSLEAIYLGIFILMAENIETSQREALREHQRKKDLAIVKQDVHVDEIALKKLKKLEKQLNTLHNLVEKKLHNSSTNQT